MCILVAAHGRRQRRRVLLRTLKFASLPLAAFIGVAAPALGVVRADRQDVAIRRAAPPAEVAPAPAAPAGETAAPRTAARVPDAGALAAFQRGATARFDAHWNPDTGDVRLLAAGRSHRYPGTPIQAATAFLRDARPLFGAQADPAVLGAATTHTHALGTQVFFPQQLNGVPVLNHGVTVNVNDSGEVILAENATAALGALDTTPLISAVRAAGAARGTVIETPALAIAANAAGARLVWRFIEEGAHGVPIRVTVDARNGRTLLRRALAHYATGSGQVYTGNPVSTPTREVKPFLYLNGTGSLTGSYTKTYHYGGSGQTFDSTFAPVQDVNVPSLQFNFAPGTDQLSEAQAYYGITTIHDYFKSTFNFTGRDQVVPGFVRVPDLVNAYFTPDTVAGNQATPNGYMAFGYGSDPGYPSRDFALDNDVLFHEYTHAVMDKWSPTFSAASYDDMERGGIGEGTADYFSCSFLNDPVLGEYVGQAFGGTPLRDLRGRDHYPEEVMLKESVALNGTTYSNVRLFPEEHQTGEIWGPGLWDVRKMLGAQKADQVIFKAMALLNGTTSFQSALGALLTADTTLYGGVDKPQISEVLNGRGITEGVYPVKYLPADAFYQSVGASKIDIGLAYKGSDGYAWYYPYDMFPSFNVGENYLFAGYVDDATIKTVALVLRNASNSVVAKAIMPVKTFSARADSGSTYTFYYFTQSVQFPASVIPTGKTALAGLHLSFQSYTQLPSTVATGFATLTPRATAPASGTTYAAQLIVPQTTPDFAPPGFGDTDGNGKVEISDALLVLRSKVGTTTLTADQKIRADIAAPQTGVPDIADAKMILQRAGGLL
jgi:Zn-dependent metalloprotease